MKRCVVHIGTSKTGTTSLQMLLAGNRDVLLDSGVLYPDLRNRPNHLHADLSRYFAGTSRPAEGKAAFKRLQEQIARYPHDVLLLSSEGFFGFADDAGAPAKLARFCKDEGYELEAVVVLRPQPDYLNSVYVQGVKLLRDTERFASFFADALAGDRFDYQSRLRQWSSHPEITLHAVPYARPVLEAGLERAVLGAAGLPVDWIDAVPDQSAPIKNVTPGPNTVEVFRRITMALGSVRVLRRADIRRRVLNRCAKKGWNSIKFQGLDDKMAAEVHSRFQASNDTVAQAYWKCPWSEMFPGAEELIPRNEFDQKAAPQEITNEIKKMSDDLVKKIQRQFGRQRFGVPASRAGLRP